MTNLLIHFWFSLDLYGPPRPPLPAADQTPPRPPPPPETDDEFEERFPIIQPNQPIMVNFK